MNQTNFPSSTSSSSLSSMSLWYWHTRCSFHLWTVMRSMPDGECTTELDSGTEHLRHLSPRSHFLYCPGGMLLIRVCNFIFHLSSILSSTLVWYIYPFIMKTFPKPRLGYLFDDRYTTDHSTSVLSTNPTGMLQFFMLISQLPPIYTRPLASLSKSHISHIHLISECGTKWWWDSR